jgi:hypothetical protein
VAFELKEKREKPRKYYSVPLVYTYRGLEAVNSKCYFSGKTFDVSDSGICFYTKKPLQVGVSIEISCKDFWHEQESGTIRWCKTLRDDHYLVGVAFQ